MEKEERKKKRAEKQKSRKEATERKKIDPERIKAVQKDLKKMVIGGERNAGSGIKPGLAAAIKAEQLKLKLLKKGEVDAKQPPKHNAAAAFYDPTTNETPKEPSPPGPGPDDKTTTKKQLMSSVMGRKELFDIFGSVNEIPSDQVFADLEKEGMYLLKKRNARFPKVRCGS